MDHSTKGINNGVIIRNGIELNGSWTKRVKHWRKSFNENSIKTSIISAYPFKPQSFINGSEGIYYLSERRMSDKLLFIFSPILLLSRLIKEKPKFVLLAHGGFFEFYTIPIYCKIKKIPLLVDIVDTVGRKYKNKKTFVDYLILFNKKLFDKYIMSQAYEIFVISSELERKYKILYPQKKISRSVPSTVDIEEFSEVSEYDISFLSNEQYNIFNNKNVVKIFYAGTIARLNGVDFFLKGFSEIKDRIDFDVKIIFAVIIGDINELLNLVSRYNLISYTEIVSTVEQKYLPILLSRADILFIPEQGIETANAGFPGKTSEYLMSGNPVITTRFSDLGDFLINGVNSCISDLGDLETYQNNLLRLIADSEFRKKIGIPGRELAISKFSHHNCALPYIKAVQSFYGGVN